MASKYINKFKVPPGFEDILNDFAKEVLRNQPKDILDFGCEYFRCLQEGVVLDYKDKGDNLPCDYVPKMPTKPNITYANNKLLISHEDKDRLKTSLEKLENLKKHDVPLREERFGVKEGTDPIHDMININMKGGEGEKINNQEVEQKNQTEDI